MKEPRHDDERLSALLAGRLQGPERDELLAYLSTADEEREVLANTVAILREMEEEDAQVQEGGVQAVDPLPHRAVLPASPTKSTRDRPRRTPQWIPIAAVLAGLVVLGTLMLRGRTPAANPMTLAASLENPGVGLPAGSDESPWGAARGEERSANAAQAGVFLLRLAVAVQTGDSARTDTLARQTRERFDPQGGEALKQIAARAGQPRDSVAPLVEEATRRLEAVYEDDVDYLRLGAWTEAARRAVGGQDEAFFATDDTRATLRRAERITRDNPAARGALEGVRAALPEGRPPVWDELQRNLEKLLRAIAS